MNTTFLLLATVTLLSASVMAEDDTPVPPEVQKLAETMVAALKSGDDAALTACWHPAEVLGKLKAAAVAAEATTSPEPVDAAKQEEKEIRRQNKNLQVTLARAAQMRALITKHFGELGQLTLSKVELDEDDEAPADLPQYDGVDICLRSADGTDLVIGVDDIVRVEGVWKFQGRLEEDVTIELPDVD
jgi:hypothetical protein